MSVTIITSAWTFFQKIPTQDFTAKMVHAIAMMELINDFKKEDREKLLWLRDNTHKDIKKSVYTLDRYVNPSKGKYRCERYTLNGKNFTQDQLQQYLCQAIEEATAIIYRNFKGFKVESKINIDEYGEQQESDGDW